MPLLKDLTGQKFGKLTVTGLAPLRTAAGATRWECRCSCGGSTVVTISNLKNGSTRSCGCSHYSQGRLTRKHPLWARWTAMIARCTQPSCAAYPNYGARGIKVCDQWHHFPNFCADMGGSFFPGATIERIENDGNYEPANCRWATVKEQNRNQRRTVRIDHNGQTLTAAEWAERVGLPVNAIELRIRAGWDPAVALTTPLIPRKDRRKGRPAG